MRLCLNLWAFLVSFGVLVLVELSLIDLGWFPESRWIVLGSLVVSFLVSFLSSLEEVRS